MKKLLLVFDCKIIEASLCEESYAKGYTYILVERRKDGEALLGYVYGFPKLLEKMKNDPSCFSNVVFIDNKAYAIRMKDDDFSEYFKVLK